MKYKIDVVHSNMSFRVKLLGLTSVGGQFNNLNGSFKKKNDDWEDTEINVEIPISSIDTGVDQRDEHLRSSDWFDEKQFPKIEFNSKSFKKDENDTYLLKGDLTIKGTTNEEFFSLKFRGKAEDQNNVDKIGFSGKTKINAKSYGLSVGQKLESGNILLGEIIPIRIDVQLISNDEK